MFKRRISIELVRLPAIFVIIAWLAGCGAQSGSPAEAAAGKSEGGSDSSSEVRHQQVAAPSSASSGMSKSASAATADSVATDYVDILNAVVDGRGLVRYSLLRNTADQPALACDRIRLQLAGGSSPADEKDLKAELINAFNLTVISLVSAQQRARENLQSVQDVPGFFNRQTFQFRGQARTLADLENRLAAMGDPRVFAALVRGSMSCPPLRAEPYQASRLDQQLDDQCRLWIDDRSKIRTVRQSLGISEIFKWRQLEFEAEPYNGAVGFLRKFSRPHGEVRDYLVGMNEKAKISYLPYDWRLNQSPDDSSPAAKPAVQLQNDSAVSSDPVHE